MVNDVSSHPLDRWAESERHHTGPSCTLGIFARVGRGNGTVSMVSAGIDGRMDAGFAGVGVHALATSH